MHRFRIKAGLHYENGVAYGPGEIVETEHDLVRMYERQVRDPVTGEQTDEWTQHKFQRLSDDDAEDDEPAPVATKTKRKKSKRR